MCHPLPSGSIVSNESSTVTLVGVPQYVMSCFSLAFFKMFSFFQHFDCSVSRCGSLCVYSSWSLLQSLDVYMKNFHQISPLFSHYFFIYYFSFFLILFPPSDVPIMHTWPTFSGATFFLISFVTILIV